MSNLLRSYRRRLGLEVRPAGPRRNTPKHRRSQHYRERIPTTGISDKSFMVPLMTLAAVLARRRGKGE